MSAIVVIYRSSSRAKHLRLTVHRDRRVVVTFPPRCPRELVERFVAGRQAWIEHALERLPAVKEPASALEKRAAYRQKKDQALDIVRPRVEWYVKRYGLSCGTIRIKNTSSRWGSCSRQGNLSFNYHLIDLSPEQLDYLVVHEVCHLKEMNHSSRFWSLVEQSIPEHKRYRKELRLLARSLF